MSTTGIYTIHSRACAIKQDKAAKCTCKPSYQAWIPPRRAGDKQIRKNFKSKAEAKAWRTDAAHLVKAGKMKAPTKTTVADAAAKMIADMKPSAPGKPPRMINRNGAPYKPSAVRSYESALKLRVLPRFGHKRLDALDRPALKEFIADMREDGHSVSTIKNTLDPLRVIYRHALDDGLVSVDPLHRLQLPNDEGTRDKVASEADVPKLIAALPADLRALWATALYVGVRRGELRELRCSDFDWDAGTFVIARALDDSGEVIAPKSEAGKRVVPFGLLPPLRQALAAHSLLTGRDGDDLFFGRTAQLPFVASTIRTHSREAWADAGLEPIGLHEGRHTAVTIMGRAGVRAEVIASIVGHNDTKVTKGRYTHIGAEDHRIEMERYSAHIGGASA